jgi:hypothetical protein
MQSPATAVSRISIAVIAIGSLALVAARLLRGTDAARAIGQYVRQVTCIVCASSIRACAQPEKNDPARGGVLVVEKPNPESAFIPRDRQESRDRVSALGLSPLRTARSATDPASRVRSQPAYTLRSIPRPITPRVRPSRRFGCLRSWRRRAQPTKLLRRHHPVQAPQHRPPLLRWVTIQSLGRIAVTAYERNVALCSPVWFLAEGDVAKALRKIRSCCSFVIAGC